MRLATFCLALALCGCGNTTVQTPTSINNQQSTVASAVKAVADADSAAVTTVISLRDQGKLSQPNTNTIENWLALVATTDKSIAAILGNGQPWAQQKASILVLLATTTAPTIATTIDPGAQAVITQVVTLLNAVKVQVTP